MEPREVTGDRILAELMGRNNSRAEIHVHAGGIGVWIVASLCSCVLVAVLVASIFIAIQLNRQAARMDDMDDYLSAIYMQAPHLKPKDEEQSK